MIAQRLALSEERLASLEARTRLTRPLELDDHRSVSTPQEVP